MQRHDLALLLMVTTLLLPAACSSPPAPMDSAELARLGVVNGRMPSPDIVAGGQLTEEQMEALAAAGYGTFINLRPADEPDTGWEEEWSRAHGVSFHRLPVAGVAGVTVDNARRMHELKLGVEGGVVIYCGSGNRVAALLALEAHHVDGIDPEASLEIGRRAGLTRLEPRVRELLGMEAAEEAAGEADG